MSIGHRFMNARSLWYFTSWAAYPPCVRILQSSVSNVVSVASSMNITLLKGVIIDLLKARCFVTVAFLRFRDEWDIEWERTSRFFHCLRLPPSTLLCYYAFFIVAEQLSEIVTEFGHLLRVETVFESLSGQYFGKYFGTGSLLESNGQNALGYTFPI